MNAARRLAAGGLGLVLGLAVWGAGPAPARALCITNGTNIPITFSIVATRKAEDFAPRFRVSLDPGKRGCCDWRNPACNAGGAAETGFNLIVDPLDRGRVCRSRVRADAVVTLRKIEVSRQTSNCAWEVK